MASHSQDPKVFLAFRFHANFYHSYRGDTPDKFDASEAVPSPRHRVHQLLAQTVDVNASLAFCPMRTRVTRRRTRVFLNPFGSYHGKQLHYPTAFTGLGKLIGTMMGESLDPLVPSYNGQSEEFSQLIAPYAGDEPPEQIRNDAETFAYPYAVLSRSSAIQPPRHRQWTYRERGGGSGRSEKGVVRALSPPPHSTTTLASSIMTSYL